MPSLIESKIVSSYRGAFLNGLQEEGPFGSAFIHASETNTSVEYQKFDMEVPSSGRKSLPLQMRGPLGTELSW
jgi:hypothetical protein